MIPKRSKNGPKTIVFNSFSKFQELQKYSELAKKVNPLVVHVRRGDYMQEKLFGLLNKDYYR